MKIDASDTNYVLVQTVVVKDGRPLQRVQWVDTDTKTCGQHVLETNNIHPLTYDRLLLRNNISNMSEVVDIVQLQASGIEIVDPSVIERLLEM